MKDYRAALIQFARFVWQSDCRCIDKDPTCWTWIPTKFAYRLGRTAPHVAGCHVMRAYNTLQREKALPRVTKDQLPFFRPDGKPSNPTWV